MFKINHIELQYIAFKYVGLQEVFGVNNGKSVSYLFFYKNKGRNLGRLKLGWKKASMLMKKDFYSIYTIKFICTIYSCAVNCLSSVPNGMLSRCEVKTKTRANCIPNI